MILLTIFLGLAVNFIGYVPPGNVNLSLVQITINRGIKQALQFIIAFSCVELVFTYMIIHAAEWLSHQLQLEVIIDWVMVVLFGVLGAITWVNRSKPPKAKVSKYHSVKHGIIMGIINPMQIPFWMISGTYLITHHWIVTGTWPLIAFSLGSAAGAFLCLFIYAKSATYIQNRFELSTKLINTCIAILFFLFAAYHIIKQVYLLNAKH
ncbi:LysE family transporter [Mucilaginibacter sp. AW1-3]